MRPSPSPSGWRPSGCSSDAAPSASRCSSARSSSTRRSRPHSASPPSSRACSGSPGGRTRSASRRSSGPRTRAASACPVSRRGPIVVAAGLGAGMVAGALIVAVVVVPFAARGAEREVLRSAVGPDSTCPRPSARSPSTAGCSPTRVPTRYSSRCRAEGRAPERVRLATLDSYDGEVYRSGGSGAVDAGRLRAHAGRRSIRGRAARVDAKITVGASDGSGCRPSAGSRRSTFEGARSATSPTGSTTARPRPRASSRQPADCGRVTPTSSAASSPARPDLAAIDAPGGVSEGVAAPENLRTWVDEHATGSGGAALAGLVSLLRERGYLSHGLSEDAGSTAWMAELPDSGSSRARPDTRSHASTRCSVASWIARPTRGPRSRATTSPPSAMTSSSPWRWRSSRGSSASPPGSCWAPASERRSPALPACAEGVCRAPGSLGVDRGAILGRRLGGDRRRATVLAVAESRGDRTARPEMSRRFVRTPSRRFCRRIPSGGLGPGRLRGGDLGVRSRRAVADAAHRARGAAGPRPLAGAVPHRGGREGRAATFPALAGALRARASPAAGTNTSMRRSTRGAMPRGCSRVPSSPRPSRHRPARVSPTTQTAPCSRARRPRTRTLRPTGPSSTRSVAHLVAAWVLARARRRPYR